MTGFDLFVRRNNWLYGLDPRVKLAFVVTAALLTFLWSAPRAAIGVALAVALLCLLLLRLARIPWPRIGGFLRGLLPLLLVVVTLTTLFAGGPGPVWLRLGPVRVTASAAVQGLLLASRLLALSLAFYFWISTTDQGAMVRGFVALRMPHTWGLTLALALRYLPILGGLFEQVSEAQQARGLDLAKRSLSERLAAYRPILVAVVIGALRHGERLGWALEARSLGAAGVRRTTYRPLRLRPADICALGLLLAVILVAVFLRMS
ncbi:MAG: Energy-coupling factor transporter transmembrane protein EcfT [Chloroflexi bacterium ADurb.Bin325]|nr:MAG: Energy-coupling factor transporter transmembrane protein EcfT [Chloroflexi bacterium ADurb.Bin325]